jgi:ABC-2 type transport system permease protein
LKGRHPLWELYLMRLRALWREPSALFWVFVFPLLISLALGLAFRNQGLAKLTVAVVEGPGSARVLAELGRTEGLQPETMEPAAARRALAAG